MSEPDLGEAIVLLRSVVWWMCLDGVWWCQERDRDASRPMSSDEVARFKAAKAAVEDAEGDY